MPQQLTITPAKLGFITLRQALEMGADPDDLDTLDFLLFCKRTYYREIDVRRIIDAATTK